MPSDPTEWDDADYEDMLDFLSNDPINNTRTDIIHPEPNPFKGEGWADEFNWEDDE